MFPFMLKPLPDKLAWSCKVTVFVLSVPIKVKRCPSAVQAVTEGVAVTVTAPGDPTSHAKLLYPILDKETPPLAVTD